MKGAGVQLSRDHDTNAVIQSTGVKFSARNDANFIDINSVQGYWPLAYPKASRNLFAVQLFLES
jgi:hypothetical protein